MRKSRGIEEEDDEEEEEDIFPFEKKSGKNEKNAKKNWGEKSIKTPRAKKDWILDRERNNSSCVNSDDSNL